MNCRILSTLYVRANAEIACEDDKGAELCLGKVHSSHEWSIDEVFKNAKYQHIRNALSQGRPPWEGICINCSLFNSAELFVDNLQNKHIRMIHIENSLLCDLECPCCSRPYEIRQRNGPRLMNLTVFERVLRSCVENGFKVENIEFAGNGEPLSHPQFFGFVRLARSIMPNSKQILVTNGNYDYKHSIKGNHLDIIFVSCDGISQGSYEKYRIGGSVSKALNFMADAKLSDQAKQTMVVWKYILFEFNDSEEELVFAQKKAVELGIDKIMFVITHTKYKSKKYSVDNILEMPLISPIAEILPIYQLTRINKVGKPITKNSNDSRYNYESLLRETYCVIDNVYISDNRYIYDDSVITVQGWATDKAGNSLETISLYCNDQFIGNGRLGVLREDVIKFYPELNNDKSGFIFINRLSEPVVISPCEMMLELKTRGGITERFSVTFSFDKS